MGKHIGYIRIDSKFLSKILDLDGAVIWNARVNDFNVLEILLEHPDLPEVEESSPLPFVHITQEAEYGDNGVLLQIKRISPPKTGK